MFSGINMFSRSPLRGEEAFNPPQIAPASRFDFGAEGESPFNFNVDPMALYTAPLQPLTAGSVALGGISSGEMAEIDAAKIRAYLLTRNGLLGTDARYARDAGTPMAIYGERTPPPGAQAYYEPTSGFAPSPENTPGVYVPEPEGANGVGKLTDILGGINAIAGTIGGLATQYYSIRGVRAGPQPPLMMPGPAPPAVTPAAPVTPPQPGTFGAPAAIRTRAAQLAKIAPRPVFNTAGFVNPFASGNQLVPLTAGVIRTGGASMAGLGKIAAIAAALGIGVEVVSAVLDSDKHKHRRKRLLTKGDIADIGTMSSMLGKNSEAFRTWLAQSLRR